ncbi:hypothetical protein HDF26_004422 [Pedobacter cryoconitis]|uniref:DUF3995 domain-containing protein n=1 Tax=Pedobacter cryoconitis TaxID=188932 RepID=UPI00160A85E4|nr:DUF3995 domain-containing protein [Pedobacter cryoconitis]MBB6273949.1 hypothetical protein [Pedobacter cryoconitis]
MTLLNTIVFLTLSFIHIYWAFGGQWGKELSVPTTGSGQKLFVPGVRATLFVAAGLLIFAAVNLSIRVLPGLATHTLFVISPLYLKYGILMIGLIFLLRSIGDFNYVGLMKKHKTSPFAKNDTRFYVPLCLIIFIAHALIFALF